jgi:glycosyltransferase involved in cell wall biosynthesis
VNAFKAPSGMDFSIVVPVYFNEESLWALYHEIEREVFGVISGRRGEVVFVNDGSGDRSFEVLKEIRTAHSDRVRVVSLSRNFGQVNAIWCGLMYARGRATVVISADGQDPASLATTMIKQILEQGEEIVICTRLDREESSWRKWTSGLFYWLMRTLCFSGMPSGGFDYFAMGRKALVALLANYQKHGFLQGQILRLGFKPSVLDYVRRSRVHGRSRWTFSKKLTYLIDGVIGYSFLPLRLMSVVGLTLSAAGFLYALVVLCARLVFGAAIYGWAPLMIVILVMGGVQMSMLGVIGEYLWRIKAQVTAEPPYIVDVVLQDDDVAG